MTDMQIVNINSDHALCKRCGSNIIDIANFSFDGEIISEPTYREEKCRCRHCSAPFLLHYDFFDADGHIHPRVFSEDINNPLYHWSEILADNQKKVISEHLRDCKICQDRLDQELLTDAWLRDFMEQLRNAKKVS